MKTFAALSMLPLAFALTAGTPASAEGPPAWAYPVNPPDLKPSPDDGTVRSVPGSSAGYTVTQLRDRFVSPIWHPGDIPSQPEVVAHGRKPDVFACGFCHRADGPGGPENANLTGLPATYIVQQMADFKSGARKSSVPERGPPTLKASLAKAVTDAEVEAAAAYFSSVKSRSIVSVVEADTVPKTYVTGWHLAVMKTGEKEPIGQRIIEVPENLEQFEYPGHTSPIHRLRSTGQHQERPGAGCHRGRGQDASVRNLSRPRPERTRAHTRDCRALAELHRAPALRFQARHPGGDGKRPHEDLR